MSGASAFVFYPSAALTVVGAFGVVLSPTIRGAGRALLGFLLLSAVVFAATTAYALAAFELVIALMTAAGVRRFLHVGDYGFLMRRPVVRSRLVTLGGAVVLVAGCALVIGLAGVGTGWHRGDEPPVTQLVALGVAVVLLVTAVGGAIVVASTSPDERALDTVLEERRRRQQRTLRRREDRARTRAAQSRPGGGE